MKKIIMILLFVLVTQFLLSCSGPKTSPSVISAADSGETKQQFTVDTKKTGIDDLMTIPNIDTKYVKLDDINPGKVDEIHIGFNPLITPVVKETADGFLCGNAPIAAIFAVSAAVKTAPSISKLDKEGKLVWKKDYEYNTYTGRINNIEVFPDGSFIFSVQTSFQQNTGHEKSFIIKCDRDGNELWKADFDDYWGGLLQYLFITEEGSIIAVGQWRVKDGKVQESDAADDIVVTKLDGDGDVVLQKSFGGNDFDSLYKARYDSTMGIVINGSSQSQDGDFAIGNNRQRADFISCINEKLDVKWVHLSKWTENFVYDQLEVNDGFVYVLGSIMEDSKVSGFLIKLDKKGSRVWMKQDIYEGLWGYAMSVLENGDIAIGSGQQNQGIIVILDKYGNEVKRLKDLKMAARCIVPTIDGGFIATSIREIKAAPQPAYISSIWYDTETVASKYDKSFSLEWRKTYDNYKDVKGMDYVLPVSDGRVIVNQYNKEAASPPEILITAGDKEIANVVGLNMWDGAIYDRETTFHTIMKEGSGIEVPYIKLGETIQIVFLGTIPDTLELKDYIVKENGDTKYTEKVVNKIPIELTNGKGTFKLDTNMAVFLSSNIEDYKPGKTFRGFRLTCSWDDNECEYGFIVRTDAQK